MIRKYLYGGPGYFMNQKTNNDILQSWKKAGRKIATGGLRVLGWLGDAINTVATSGASSDFGQTSPFANLNRKEVAKGRERARQKSKEAVEKASPYISPANHVTAWTQGSFNPMVGAKKLEELGPEAQFAGALFDIATFAKGKPAVRGTFKAATKAVDATKGAVGKAVKNSKTKEVAKVMDKVIDKGFKPRLSSDKNLYRTTTDKEVSALKSGRFEIHPNGGNHGVYGWRRGEPFYQPGSMVESKMIGKRNGISEGVDNPTYLVAPIREDLQVRIGSGGKYSEPVPATEVESGTSAYYHPSGGLAYDNSSIGFLPGDKIPNGIVAWSKKNGKWLFEPIEQPKQIYRATKQRRVISEGTYPWYRGKQHSVKEVVNPDGTVNPRQAMRILHEVSELFPGSYKMERRLENPKWHKEDPNTYEHTKRVALSAWGLDVPYGFTKHDQMVAALGHDFGKIVAGDGHAQIGADLARQVFPDLTDAQYTAIAEHMGTPKTPLGKATKAADIDNGRSVIRRSENEINISPQELFKALQELEGYYFRGHGTGRTGVDPQIIFNNGLRIKGGDIGNTTIPISESNLTSWPHMNSEEIIIMPGKAAMSKYDSAHGYIPSDWYSSDVFHWTDNPKKVGSGPFAAFEPNASFTEQTIGGVPGVYTKPEAVLGSYNTRTHTLRLNPNSLYKFLFNAPRTIIKNKETELYALRDNTGGNSKITVPDVYKSLVEAEEYKGSKGYKDLVHRAQKEAKEMGLPFSSDLYLGVNNYFPSIKLSSRPKGKLGGYRKSTNTIELDPDLLSPIEGKYVPFHEGLHWLRVGTPEMNSPLYNRWKLNMKDELAWHDFYHSKEHSKLKYEDNAKAYARKKVKEALYEDADPYLSIPGELLINGLEAGRAIGLEPFAEYPGYGKALEAANKAREYNKWLYDVKAGTSLEMLNFWKILTGNYIPSVSIPLTTGYTLYNIFNQPQQRLQYLKQGGKTHKPFGHRSILDNGWQSTKQLKNKKNVYGK